MKKVRWKRRTDAKEEQENARRKRRENNKN